MAESRARRGTAFRLARERISACRRDIIKMIAVAGDWQSFHALFRPIVERMPRTPTHDELEPTAEELGLLAEELTNRVEDHVFPLKKSSSADQI